MEASTPLVPLSIMVSGNKDSSISLVSCDCRVHIPKSEVSPARLGQVTNIGSQLCLRSPRWPVNSRGWQGWYLREPVGYLLFPSPRRRFHKPAFTGCVPHHTIFPIGLFPTHLLASVLRTSGLILPLPSAPHRYPGKEILGHGHQIVA